MNAVPGPQQSEQNDQLEVFGESATSPGSSHCSVLRECSLPRGVELAVRTVGVDGQLDDDIASALFQVLLGVPRLLGTSTEHPQRLAQCNEHIRCMPHSLTGVFS